MHQQKLALVQSMKLLGFEIRQQKKYLEQLSLAQNQFSSIDRSISQSQYMPCFTGVWNDYI